MNELPRDPSAYHPSGRYRAEDLLPLVYDGLRKLAAQKLVEERPGHTLQPTALVHEAYLRLVGSGIGGRESGAGSRESGVGLSLAAFDSPGHFYAAAAEAMRRILVEAARRKQTLKRGGASQRVELDATDSIELSQTLDLLALDDALAKLAQEDPPKAELVKLRFFAGLTMPQAAKLLGISLATAERHWTFTRAWLLAELEGERKIAEKPAAI
jgi:RNA polymerase sigma factor (sigma-70 family)